MRKTLRLAFTALLFAPACAFAWQGQGTQQTTQTTSTQAQTQKQAKSQPAPSPANPLVAAANNARQNQKSASAPVVYTNENLPRASSISIVGSTSTPDARARAQEDAADAKADEKMWRQKFAAARAKLRRDREKLATLKSDLNALGMVRYFNEADAVSKQQAVIDEENQINTDQKVLDDLEDALRKAGGDSAWAQ